MRRTPHESRKLTYLLVALVALLAPACASGNGSGDWVIVSADGADSGSATRITGTVRHMDLEGGLYVIRDPEGKNYNPTNLPEAFQVDKMRVEAEARPRDDLASIGMVGPLVEILRIRELAFEDVAGPRPTDGPGDSSADLRGTSWRLEDLAGAGVIDMAQATLEFTEDDRVGGSGSCNRFRGTVEVHGDSISFGPLATTRMACAEAVNNQETNYIAALSGAERFRIDEPFLFIHAAGLAAPLKFIRADESDEVGE